MSEPATRTTRTTRTTRVDKVRENDRKLRDAVEAIVAESGWSAVTFAGVAKRAGLTVGAVYARFENLSELGNDLWTSTIEGFFARSVDELLAAVRSGDPERVREFATGWDAQTVHVPVLVELLVAALFDDELAEGVGQATRDLLARHCVPDGPDDAHCAAVATLALSFFFGRALALRASHDLPPLTDEQVEVLAAYSAAGRGDIDPADVAPLAFLCDTAGLDLETARIDRCVIETLGRLGYRRTTVARLARAAGISKGAFAARFDTKAHLIADTAGRTVLTPLEVWRQYEPVVRAHGPLTARALFLAEFLDPEHRDWWRVNLELAHAALTVPELAAFATPADTLEHTHLGVMLVACFVDGLDRLPYAGPFGAGSAT